MVKASAGQHISMYLPNKHSQIHLSTKGSLDGGITELDLLSEYCFPHSPKISKLFVLLINKLIASLRNRYSLKLFSR